MRIERLVIDPEREDHIARHGVAAEEVWQLIERAAYHYERTRQDRLLLVGQSDAGRYLAVVVAPRGEGVYGLVTARDADDAERRRFRRHRGR